MIRQRSPALCSASRDTQGPRATAAQSFRETLKDKDFLAEAVKSKLDVDPLSGEEVEKTVAGIFKLDSALVAKMGEK